MQLKHFHKALVKVLAAEALTDRDGVLLFWILHSHRIRLVPGSLEGLGCSPQDFIELEPITLRHAADCVAELYQSAGKPRSRYVYWYSKWHEHSTTAGELKTKTGEDIARIAELKNILQNHESVVQLVED